MATGPLNYDPDDSQTTSFKIVKCILCQRENVLIPSDGIGANRLGPKCAELTESERRAFVYAHPERFMKPADHWSTAL